MKQTKLLLQLLLACCVLTGCGGYPEVLNKNQYVHMFFIQNDTPYDLALLQETKSSMTGTGTSTGNVIFAEALVNNSEAIENTLLSLSQEVQGKLTSVMLVVTENDEEGDVLYSDSYPFTAEKANSPYWSENYVLTPNDEVSYGLIESYEEKVLEGHVKVYVLHVTEEYLQTLL